MRLVDLVHVLFDLLIGQATRLGREQAIVRVPQGCVRSVPAERRKHLVAQQFIEALRRRSQPLQVRVIEGPHPRMGEHLPIGRTQHQIDGVRGRPIGERVARKEHTVAGKTRIEAALRPLPAAVADPGDNIGAGILMEGGFEMPLLAAAGIEVQPRPNLAQAADSDEVGEGPWEGIEALVNDKRVEFVGEGPRLPIARVVRHLPVIVQGPLGGGAVDMDGERSALGQVMDGEAR